MVSTSKKKVIVPRWSRYVSRHTSRFSRLLFHDSAVRWEKDTADGGGGGGGGSGGGSRECDGGIFTSYMARAHIYSEALSQKFIRPSRGDASYSLRRGSLARLFACFSLLPNFHHASTRQHKVTGPL